MISEVNTKETSNAAHGRKLNAMSLCLLALPTSFTEMSILPFALIIPLFYAKTTGISLAVIGSIMMATKLIDAFTDPIMGIASDKIETKYGRRKPWVVIGSFVFALGFFLVFTPSANSGAAYFTVWAIVMYLGYTIFSVPKYAWHSEISRDYDERQRVVTFVTIGFFISSFLIMALPLILSPITGTTEFTGEVLKIIAIVVAVCLPVTSILAAKHVPKEERLSEKSGRVRDLPDIFLHNRPFQIFIVAFTFWQAGMGLWMGATYIYVDVYLKIGDKFVWVLLIGYFIRLLFTPIWLKIINRTEKHIAFCFAALGNALFVPFALFLEPGPESFIPLLFLAGMVSVFDAVLFILPPSILGDTADYDSYLTGLDRTASYKSALSLVLKGALALGSGFALILIDYFGFTPDGHNDTHAIWGLKLVIGILPVIFFVIAAVVMFFFKLTRQRHGKVIRIIEKRQMKRNMKIEKEIRLC